MGQGLYETLVSELEAVAPISGLLMTDILDLPDALRQVVRWILRQKYVAQPDLASYLNIDDDTSIPLVEMLLQKGYLEESKAYLEEPKDSRKKLYRIRMITVTHTTERKKKAPDLWETLGEDPPKKY